MFRANNTNSKVSQPIQLIYVIYIEFTQEIKMSIWSKGHNYNKTEHTFKRMIQRKM